MRKFYLQAFLIILFPLCSLSQVTIDNEDDERLITLQDTRDSLKSLLTEVEREIKLIQSRREIAQRKRELTQGFPVLAKKDVPIYSERAVYSIVLDTLPMNTILKGFDRKSGYYMVEYDTLSGYVSFMDVETLDERDKRLEIEQERREEVAQKRVEDTKRRAEAAQLKKAREQRLNEKYGTYVTSKILDGKIWLRMTNEMVVESWGNPSKKNKSVGSWGVKEQWIYSSAYLYISNGVLDSWQTKSR